MSRLSTQNVELAHEIIALYPQKKSALIPLLHLAQEQDGHVTDDAMAHIAELCDVTPAEVVGTCSFYEMFKRHETGTYLINVCTNISCMLLGGEELFEHVTDTLGVRHGGTTDDGMFTVEDYECLAACSEAPCLQVNYRYFHRITTDEFDELIADLRAGRRTDIPPHGTLGTIRQRIPAGTGVGPVPPQEVDGAPVWLRAGDGDGEGSDG